MSWSDYNRDGFVFMPSMLTPAEAAILAAEFDAVADDEQRPGRVLEKDGHTLRSVFNPHRYSTVFESVIRHPRILGTVLDLLREPVYAYQLVVNNKAAFNGDIWFWHQDYPTYRADDNIAECRMVNALIFLDEVTQFNGPLMVVPGSHRMDSERPDESSQGTSYTIRYSSNEVIANEVRRGGIVAPTGPAGSVIFMHANTLHGSASNLSPWSRRMITLTYNAMSNKATAPTVRSRDIVPDDTHAVALSPLGDDCLRSLSPRS